MNIKTYLLHKTYTIVLCVLSGSDTSGQSTDNGSSGPSTDSNSGHAVRHQEKTRPGAHV